MGTLQGDFAGFGAYTLGLNSAMSIMGQEAGHRWLAFPAFQRPTGALSSALLGRSSARDDVLVCGDREDLTVANITAAGALLGPSNGPRDPVIGDEQDAGPGIGPADDAKCVNDRECVDVKTMAFILLVHGDPSSRASAISQVDTFRRTWEEYANNAAVGGLGARARVGDAAYIQKFDTSLSPAIH